MRMGRTFGAALTARRALGAAEAGSLIWGVLLLGALGFVGVWWPKGLAYPLGVLLLWTAISWSIQIVKLLRKRTSTAAKTDGARPRREDAA
jgi:cardiolipin synthase